MTRRLFLAVFAFALGALSGCASRSVPKDFSLEAAKSEGVVIVSVTHDPSGGRKAKAIFYVNGGSMEKGGGMLMSLTDAFPGIPGGSDFEEDYGKLFALQLPAGHHAISSWQISNGSGLRIHPREMPAPLEFDVSAGEIKYLGNLHANLATGRNVFGMTIVGNGYPEVRDERDRDVAVFRKKYPQLGNVIPIELLKLGPWVPGAGSKVQMDLPPPATGIPARN